jgi:hydroxyacylglutathione hydrolase
MQYQIIPVTPFQQNCTLWWCDETRKAAVVDPGGDVSLIQNAIKKAGVIVEKILLTHGHLDHVGATGDLAQLLEVPIIGPHKGDQYWIDGLDKQSAMFGFPIVTHFQPDLWLDHGNTVTVGKQTLEVLHCPGHTPGHVVFFHRASGVAQVGDVLFNGSIGRTDFPGGNHADLIASIKERLFPLGDDVVFIPGHGPTSTLGYERESNPFVSDKRG